MIQFENVEVIDMSKSDATPEAPKPEAPKRARPKHPISRAAANQVVDALRAIGDEKKVTDLLGKLGDLFADTDADETVDYVRRRYEVTR
jgi:hypothetical protein